MSYLKIAAPGVERVLVPAQGQNIEFAFAPSAAAFERAGNDLVLGFEQGGQVVLENFFLAGEKNALPELRFPDDTVLGGADFLRGIDPDFDVSTAMGPSSAQSGGMSDYTDGAGDLLSGVDRLGSLGTSQWSQNSGRGAALETPSMLPADAAAAPADPGGENPGGSEPPVIPQPTDPLHAITIHHQDPSLGVSYGYQVPAGSYAEYDGTLYANTAAVGKDATAGTVADGDFTLSVGGKSVDAPQDGATVSYLSAVYAGDGGQNSIEASGGIDITSSVGGTETTGGTASVSAIRSQGAVQEGEYYSPEVDAARVSLKADGDISLTTNITGNAGTGNHEGVSYAAVAATERGKVDIESDGQVDIITSNKTGGGSLETSGTYGIFSGYGFGREDLPADLSQPLDEYGYMTVEDAYNGGLQALYSSDQRNGNQSEVVIKAEGDVNVGLELGQHGSDASAAAIAAAMGDVRIESGGNISVTTTIDQHTDDGTKQASALEIKGGEIHLKAEGDVNVSLEGNGNNLSVINFDRFDTTTPNRHSLDGSSLTGKNVFVTGEAGLDTLSLDNSITGLNAAYFSKKENFTVNADEIFSVDVTAYDNGGSTSSTGLLAGSADSYYASHMLNFAFNAEETEITARVVQRDGAEPGLDSNATGVRLLNEHVYITGGDTGYGYVNTRPMQSLSIAAEGARHNTGLIVETTEERQHLGHGAGSDTWRSNAYVQADKLQVTASGGANDGGATSSRGIVVTTAHDNDYASLTIFTNDLSVVVDNPVESVGLLADNGGQLTINYGDDAPGGVSVVITCTVTNPDLLPEGTRAVAIEAANGGKVYITTDYEPTSWWKPSYQGHSDTVSLTGDVTAHGQAASGDYSFIEIFTGAGSDLVEVNGNLSADDYGRVSVDTGSGNDSLIFNGGISVGENSQVLIDAGSGNEIITLNGAVSNNGGQLTITGGEGYDLLILQAPSAEDFDAYYKEWFESGALNGLSCESIIVQVDDPSSLGWLSDMIRDNGGGIDLQFVSTDTNLTVVDSLGLDGSFTLDGSQGADDMLYVRMGEGSENLQGLHDAFQSGGIKGLESLVLDMADGHNQNLDSTLFNSVIGSVRGGDNATANILMRMDEGDIDGLLGSGWSSQNTTTEINGQEYTVYANNDNPELGDLYIQLITGS